MQFMWNEIPMVLARRSSISFCCFSINCFCWAIFCSNAFIFSEDASHAPLSMICDDFNVLGGLESNSSWSHRVVYAIKREKTLRFFFFLLTWVSASLECIDEINVDVSSRFSSECFFLFICLDDVGCSIEIVEARPVAINTLRTLPPLLFNLVPGSFRVRVLSLATNSSRAIIQFCSDSSTTKTSMENKRFLKRDGTY